tara:strand:+ start:42 stop:260 length:219 start_codon:yes stop_codon:yes gene_type:complete
MLSATTIQSLSTALTPEVIDYIFADERWVDFMMEVVSDAVSEKLGSQDLDLVTELSMVIMDNINLKPRLLGP